MSILSKWILTVLLSIAPTAKYQTAQESEQVLKARYTSIAEDMASAIQNSEPLFTGEDAELKTAALVSSIAFMESGFRKSVDQGNLRGDNGRSWCLMQINLGNGRVKIGDETMRSWRGRDLVADRKKCFAVGIETLRLSMSRCTYLPEGGALSVYTSGQCLAHEKSAKVRWNFSQRIYRKYSPLFKTLDK